MKDAKRILITGASGFTGRHACSYFRKKGFFTAASVHRGNLQESEADQIEICNLLDKNSLDQLVKKTDPGYVLHLAAQNHVGKSWEDPSSSFEANVLSTLYLLEALRRLKPEARVLVTGSALQSCSEDHPHPYSLTKSMQTSLARAWESLFKMDVMIAKPCNLIGPGNSNGVCSLFASRIARMESGLEEKVLYVNSLQSSRDFLDVRDAVRAYGFILEKGERGGIYDVSSGSSLTLGDVAGYLKACAKTDFEVDSKSADPDSERYSLDPGKLQKLGWNPEISREQTFEDLLHYQRDILINEGRLSSKEQKGMS
ncbi:MULTISPECIES: NAD-dependent epimerase/dehydratase family protein [Bacillus]|uniref:NAD-dependent epimerase/dehydratase family protein n=1 Tax=Bacillus TaxID=1386 RepID=UPI001CD6D44D|nr:MULTISPECIES: NAD-dependent epimerase/dehydratase family protein [Bacillus]MCA1036802.1 NAD-dependent epimerase/dehydratase family protein [Bacillus infantis]